MADGPPGCKEGKGRKETNGGLKEDDGGRFIALIGTLGLEGKVEEAAGRGGNHDGARSGEAEEGKGGGRGS
jgi:hypothetical protein